MSAAVTLYSRIEVSLHWLCNLYEIVLTCVEIARTAGNSSIFESLQPAM